MSVTAKFSADFSDFTAAVTKADVQLKTFETGAGKVQTSLNKMSNSLSGTRMIQDATLMAEAVERVGGVSKLTEKELERVSAQATEAANKLRALGQDVPPGIQKIADATNKAANEVVDWKSAIGSAAAAFGLAFSVGAVVSFGKKVLDTAGQINDMASRLAISTDAVQGFKYAAEQSGSSIDAVGAAIGKMSAELAGGDKGTVQALKDAGLGFQQIRSMKPEDAFLAIADAIAKIPDPMQQVEVGRKLMGKGFDELLPAIRAGFRETADSASKMSEETIKALDDAGDAWATLANNVTIFTGGIIAEMMRLPQTAKSAFAGVTGSMGAFAVFAENALKMGVGPALAMASAFQEASTAAAKVAPAAAPVPPVIKKTAEELAAAAAAAQKYADAFAAMVGKFSGSSATAEMKMLDAVFRKLSDSGQLTAKQIDAIVKEALKLSEAGGKITPRLMQMAIATGAIAVPMNTAALNFKELGTQVTMAIPPIVKIFEAMNKLDPDPAVVGIGNLTTQFAALVAVSPQTMLKGVLEPIKQAKEETERTVEAVGHLVGAFDLLASASSGDFANIIASLGDLTAAVQNVIKLQAQISASGGLSGGGGEGGAGSKLAMVGNIALLATGYGAVAMAAYKAGKAIVSAMNDGRKAVEDFAKSAGGFDALQKQMLTLGDDYDRFWKKLTQETKRGDKEGALKVIAEIKEALANTPQALASAAGFQTIAELQAVADKAKKTYDYMVSSGQFSAGEIARAFEASAAAQKAALGDSAKAQQDALDGISEKYKDTIGKLDSELKSLNDSISKEAEEEFMGVVEAQERARRDQVVSEKAAQEAMRDAEIEAKKQSFDEILKAGKDVDEQLRELFGKPFKMGSPEWPSGMPGGGGDSAPTRYTGPTTAPSPDADSHVTVIVPIDGEVVTKAVVRVAKRRGLT